MQTLSCLNHRSPFFSFHLLCRPLSDCACTFDSNIIYFWNSNVNVCPFSWFFVPSRHPFGTFSVFEFFFFAIMPFPLSFGGGGIFASVFCIYFCRTHRTHRAPRQNDVHICRNDVPIYPHRRTLCASQSEYPQSQKQKQRQKRTLTVVKLLIKLFYLVTIITTTLSGGIAATDDKYDSVFHLRQHPANLLPRLNNASAPNRSLEARTESNCGIHDIKNSLAIVQCECKNDKLTSRKCGSNTNDRDDSDNIQYQSREIKAFHLLAAGEYSQPTISFAGFVSHFEVLGVATLTSVGFNYIFPWTTTTNSCLRLENIFVTYYWYSTN